VVGEALHENGGGPVQRAWRGRVRLDLKVSGEPEGGAEAEGR